MHPALENTRGQVLGEGGDDVEVESRVHLLAGQIHVALDAADAESYAKSRGITKIVQIEKDTTKEVQV